MRPIRASIALGLSFCAAAHAAVISQPFTGGFVNGVDIPDGNTTGWWDSRTLSGPAGATLSAVSVSLDLVGGFNGDLYAYLSHDGVLVPLLNRVGVTATSPASSFGYSDAGFEVTFSTSAAADVHFYNRDHPALVAGQLTGSWQPDGRAIDPLSTPASFDAAARISLDAFNGHDPNGTWTLFIADLSAGGQSQVRSWELDLTTAEPPVTHPAPDSGGTLALLGAALLGIVGYRSTPR